VRVETVRNSLYVTGADIPSRYRGTPINTYRLLDFIDERICIGTAQLKSLGTGKQVFTDRERAVFTNNQRKIAPLRIAWLRH